MAHDTEIFQTTDPTQKIAVGLSSVGSSLIVLQLQQGDLAQKTWYLDRATAAAIGEQLIRLGKNHYDCPKS